MSIVEINTINTIGMINKGIKIKQRTTSKNRFVPLLTLFTLSRFQLFFEEAFYS